MSHLIVRCKTPTIVARMLAITVGVFLLSINGHFE